MQRKPTDHTEASLWFSPPSWVFHIKKPPNSGTVTICLHRNCNLGVEMVPFHVVSKHNLTKRVFACTHDLRAEISCSSCPLAAASLEWRRHQSLDVDRAWDSWDSFKTKHTWPHLSDVVCYFLLTNMTERLRKLKRTCLYCSLLVVLYRHTLMWVKAVLWF